MVSIIVPVYKAEAFLDKCWRSVQAQTEQDWELIFVDDGSPDDCGRLCDEYAALDRRVRVIHQENRGLSAARNAGMALAAGEYTAFLDSDDRLEPAFLETLLGELERTGADCAGCAHYKVWPDGGKEPELLLPAGFYDRAALLERVVRPLLRDRLEEPLLNGFVWRWLYRTEQLRASGIRFHGGYLEDEIFLIEHFSRIDSAVVTETPLYDYVQNPGSVTRSWQPDYVATFRGSYEAKQRLVERFQITGIDGWQAHTCWAGLLIAVGNVFARGNPAGFFGRRKQLIALTREPEFAMALRELKPRNPAGNKKPVVLLLRARQLTLLSLLYTLKNRGR